MTAEQIAAVPEFEFAQDVIYLMGGERREYELVRFTRVGKRLIRNGADLLMADESALEPFSFF